MKTKKQKKSCYQRDKHLEDKKNLQRGTPSKIDHQNLRFPINR